MRIFRAAVLMVLVFQAFVKPALAGTDYYRLDFSSTTPGQASGSGWISVNNLNGQVFGGALSLSGSFFTQNTGSATILYDPSARPSWVGGYYSNQNFQLFFYEVLPVSGVSSTWYTLYVAEDIFDPSQPPSTGIQKYVGSSYPTNPGTSPTMVNSFNYTIQSISGPLGAPELDASESRLALLLMAGAGLLLQRRRLIIKDYRVAL